MLTTVQPWSTPASYPNKQTLQLYCMAFITWHPQQDLLELLLNPVKDMRIKFPILKIMTP